MHARPTCTSVSGTARGSRTSRAAAAASRHDAARQRAQRRSRHPPSRRGSASMAPRALVDPVAGEPDARRARDRPRAARAADVSRGRRRVLSAVRGGVRSISRRRVNVKARARSSGRAAGRSLDRRRSQGTRQTMRDRHSRRPTRRSADSRARRAGSPAARRAVASNTDRRLNRLISAAASPLSTALLGASARWRASGVRADHAVARLRHQNHCRATAARRAVRSDRAWVGRPTIVHHAAPRRAHRSGAAGALQPGCPLSSRRACNRRRGRSTDAARAVPATTAAVARPDGARAPPIVGARGTGLKLA